MDLILKSNKWGLREFDFNFVIKKDEEMRVEDGIIKIVKLEVVVSWFKVIVSGGECSLWREWLVFDL